MRVTGSVGLSFWDGGSWGPALRSGVVAPGGHHLILGLWLLGAITSFKCFNNTSATWKGPSSIHTFHFDVITSDYVMKHLLCLPNRSNNDILEFDSKLLKLSAFVFCPYLTCLFNLFLQQKLVPVDWKTVRVTPIYKGKGSRSDSTNYHPISVICHIAKCLKNDSSLNCQIILKI